MVKYIDGLVKDCGKRIKQEEIVFAGTWHVSRSFEVSGNG